MSDSFTDGLIGGAVAGAIIKNRGQRTAAVVDYYHKAGVYVGGHPLLEGPHSALWGGGLLYLTDTAIDYRRWGKPVLSLPLDAVQSVTPALAKRKTTVDVQMVFKGQPITVTWRIPSEKHATRFCEVVNTLIRHAPAP